MGAAPFSNAEMSVCYENENIFHANERNDVARTKYVYPHKIYMRTISFARIIHIMRQFICAKLYSHIHSSRFGVRIVDTCKFY